MISAPDQRRKLSTEEIVTQREVFKKITHSVPRCGQGQRDSQSATETSSIETLRLFTSSSVYFGTKRMDGITGHRSTFRRSGWSGGIVLGTSCGDTWGAIFSAIRSDGSVETVPADLVTRCSYSDFWRGLDTLQAHNRPCSVRRQMILCRTEERGGTLNSSGMSVL